MDPITIKNELIALCNNIKQNLILELQRQGHRATGDLINSLDVVTEQISGAVSIVGRYVYYGRFVDTGRNAGLKGVPIDALIAWIRVKNIDLMGNSEKSVAFAIMNAIKKHGIPTNRDMSKRRFMSGTLERMETQIFDRITEAYGRAVEKEIVNLIEQTQTSINSIQYHN